MSRNQQRRSRKPSAPKAIIPGAGAVMGVITKFAGSVDLTLPAGMGIPEASIDLNLTEAGAVNSTLIAGTAPLSAADDGVIPGGVYNLPRDADLVGLRVNTTRAGSVLADGDIKDIDTSYAGSVKISCTGTGTGAVRDGKEGATTRSRTVYLPLAMLAGGVAVAAYGFSR